MNVALNTSIYGNNNKSRNVAFNGAVPKESAFFKPFKNATNALTDAIADYYTAPIAYSNSLTNWLSRRKNLDKIVGHMQTAGSFIISGMYMIQTLRNDNLDEKKKKTLAVNQGLTLLFSTLGAYLLDSKLVNIWNKYVTNKYVAKHIGKTPEELAENLKTHQKNTKERFFENHQEDVKLENVDLKAQKKAYDKEIKSGLKLPEFGKYLDNLLERKSTKLELKIFKTPNLLHYVEKGLKNTNITADIKALDALKSLIVFGTVYRFIGPVAVTPVANMIGNRLFYSKENKSVKENAEQIQQATDSTKDKYLANNQPKFDKFLSEVKK